MRKFYPIASVSARLEKGIYAHGYAIVRLGRAITVARLLSQHILDTYK